MSSIRGSSGVHGSMREIVGLTGNNNNGTISNNFGNVNNNYNNGKKVHGINISGNIKNVLFVQNLESDS